MREFLCLAIHPRIAYVRKGYPENTLHYENPIPFIRPDAGHFGASRYSIGRSGGIAGPDSLKSDTTYVVNFWATWCAPCVKELPYFEELNEKHPDGKVKVLLVSLDADDNKEKRLIPFVEGRDIRSEVLHFNESRSPNYWIPEISKQWRGSIPATLFINGSTGNSLFLEKSFHSLEEIEEVILRLK